MLKNVDFKKMSYDEGLALVAETRKKSLQGSHVKQANSMVDAVKSIGIKYLLKQNGLCLGQARVV